MAKKRKGGGKRKREEYKEELQFEMNSAVTVNHKEIKQVGATCDIEIGYRSHSRCHSNDPHKGATGRRRRLRKESWNAQQQGPTFVVPSEKMMNSHISSNT